MYTDGMEGINEYERENLKNTRINMAMYCDKRHLPEPEVMVGQHVMLDARNIKSKWRTQKLTPTLYAPFVGTWFGILTCTFDLGNRGNIFSDFLFTLLEPHCKGIQDSCKQELLTSDNIEGELEYEVEAIVQSEKRMSGSGVGQVVKMFYWVKWLA